MSIKVRAAKQFTDFALDVSFESSSKRIGILGASGCGKSMTLKSIAGLIVPDKGMISLNKTVFFDSDRRINIKPADRRVGYLFQDYALFPNMTVKENIEAALKGAGRVNGRTGSAQDILRKFGLTSLKDHRPHELSGGQKQRTALARMLACDPGLLLLDEPFSAMDTFLREGMRLELIRLLNKYDKSVIMVSHDRDEIYQMCDYLILMENGRVIEHGKTDDLFMKPSNVASAKLTGCKNISRIERITEHRVRALDWNGIELVTDDKVDERIGYIGIRAHDIMPGEKGVNVIPCGQAMINKMPFEWYVTLECGLWWKLPRDLDQRYSSDIVPRFVSILPEKIVLLKCQ